MEPTAKRLLWGIFAAFNPTIEAQDGELYFFSLKVF